MRPSAAGAALLAGLLAAGCGGGGRLSKQDYAKQADAICSKYNRKIEALGRPKSAALAEIARFAEQALALERKGNAELAGLKPPKSEEKTAQEWHGARVPGGGDGGAITAGGCGSGGPRPGLWTANGPPEAPARFAAPRTLPVP